MKREAIATATGRAARAAHEPSGHKGIALVCALFGYAMIACTATPSGPEAPAPRPTLRILVPNPHNLQLVTFWLGLDRFESQGGRVELLIPPVPQATRDWMTRKSPDVAILPAPILLDHLALGTPMGRVANLLSNDPINLIIRRSVAETRGLSPSMPLRDRLEGLRGLKLGIARHPPPRLRALFSEVGLDVDAIVETVHLGGKRQNRAFARGEVDVLFAHTPFLEHALVHQDAVLLVELSAGEVATLGARTVHVAVASPEFESTAPREHARFFEALEHGRRLLHDRPAEAVTVLARLFPKRDPRELAMLVELYGDAVPRSLDVTVGGLEAALRFYPEGFAPPEIDRTALERFVAIGSN